MVDFIYFPSLTSIVMTKTYIKTLTFAALFAHKRLVWKPLLKIE
jgi:hypothetical protein